MFHKKRLLIIAIFSLIVLSLLAIGAYIFLTRSAGLEVDASPQSKVYVDGKQLGSTPVVLENVSPGIHKLKIISEQSANDSYEIKVVLTPGAKTVVNRVFGKTKEFSLGTILYYEKLGINDVAALTVISSPDSASVRVDGQEKGLTPLSLDILGNGGHDVVLSKVGYGDQLVSVRLEKGYRLNVISDLAKGIDIFSVPKATPSGQLATPSASLKAIILPTPTGFLRVRQEPTINASEVGRIKPGDSYLILASQSGWLKIKFGEEEGWVSSDYVKQ